MRVPSLGAFRPNPVKILLSVLRIDEQVYHKNTLAGFPGLPPFEDFKKMLDGTMQMPYWLELHVFRKCFNAYGCFWQIVGGDPSGKLAGEYTRSDGMRIRIVELE